TRRSSDLISIALSRTWRFTRLVRRSFRMPWASETNGCSDALPTWIAPRAAASHRARRIFSPWPSPETVTSTTLFSRYDWAAGARARSADPAMNKALWSGAAAMNMWAMYRTLAAWLRNAATARRGELWSMATLQPGFLRYEFGGS